MSELQHYGVLGMKWRKRKVNRENLFTKIDRVNNEYADAQAKKLNMTREEYDVRQAKRERNVRIAMTAAMTIAPIVMGSLQQRGLEYAKNEKKLCRYG